MSGTNSVEEIKNTPETETNRNPPLSEDEILTWTFLQNTLGDEDKQVGVKASPK